MVAEAQARPYPQIPASMIASVHPHLLLVGQVKVTRSSRGGGRSRVHQFRKYWRAAVSVLAGRAYNVYVATRSACPYAFGVRPRVTACRGGRAKGGSRDPTTSCATHGDRSLVGASDKRGYRRFFRAGSCSSKEWSASWPALSPLSTPGSPRSRCSTSWRRGPSLPGSQR